MELMPTCTCDCAAQIAEASQRIANLEIALQTNRRIAVAVGIVMANGKVTEGDAFCLLVRASQTTHRKVRDIADDVVETGTILLPVSRRAAGVAL